MKLTPNKFMLTAAFIGAVATQTLILPQAQAFTWNGSVSSDPTNAANWTGGAPTFGGSVSGSLDVNNVTASPLIYTSAQGTTVFSSYLDVGVFQGTGSSFQMTGGTATFNSNSFPSAIGFGGTNSMSVSGGTLNFTGAFTGGGGPDSFWLTNDGNGTFNLSGGTVNIAQELALNRNGGTANLNITGGVFNVQGSTGTLYNGNGGGGLATITFGLGSGVFEQTASDAITGLGANFNINFLTGSGGQFTLTGANSTTNLQTYILGGYIQVGGVDDTTLSDYYITTSGSGSGLTSTLSLVPEPSTWALFAMGLGLLVVLRRRLAANQSV